MSAATSTPEADLLGRAECLPAQQAFSPVEDTEWEKHHDRLERRRVTRVDVGFGGAVAG